MILIAILISQCQGTLKFPLLQDHPVSGDAYAIFRADFPFEISPETPDPSTVIPPGRPGCKVKLLPAGKDAFAVKYYIIENASATIKLQTYILYRDPVSKKAVEILKRKQAQGVQVQFIADCYTKFIPKDRLLYFQMEKAGLDLRGFEPIYFSAMNDSNPVYDVDELNMRFHEKYWIVDDYVAITGGTNISQEYALYQNRPRLMWRDQDALVVGPVVHDFTRAFDENYQYFSRKEMDRPKPLNPQWYKQELGKQKNPGGEKGQGSGTGSAGAIKLENFDDEDALVRFIRHRPRLQETYVHQAYLHLIRTARKKILIENSYILLDPAQLAAFLDAAHRGIEITIVTNCEATNDVFGLAPLTRYHYLELMQAGIRIYEWQGIVRGKGSLHSKYAVFDDDLSIIGSYNLDPRSTFLNSEDILVIRSRNIADKLRTYTETIDLANSEQVTMAMAEKWHNPNSPARIWTKLAMIFRDWW